LSKCLAKVIDYRGRTPKKLGREWASAGYRALSANNVKFSGLDKLESINYADEDLYREWMKEEVRRGDLLLTSEAPSGQVMLWDSDEKIVLSQRLYALRTNSTIDGAFLKYYLQSPSGQKEIFRNNSGSTVAGISAKTFDNILIRHPEKNIQQKIGYLLYSIDKRIDCNNRINAELEAMAKTLYDYWFVQFDFPDANGKPYKSYGGKMVYNATLKREIPAEWRGGTLADLISLEYGKSLKADIRTGSGYPVIGSNGVVDYHSEFLVSGPGIVVGRKGTVGAVTYLHDNFFPIDTTYYIKPVADIEFIYLKHLLSSQGLEKMNSDSAVPGLNREAALRTSAVIPSVTLIKQFELNLAPVFKKLHNIEQENHQLARLRDWLLPLLMNGQVTVT